MTKGVFALASFVLVLSVPVLVAGFEFDYEIYGNILQSPVVYDGGGLTSGGDGYFDFDLNDAGWPTGDPNARFDYIWATYFADNYDASTPGAYKWVGQFVGRFHLQVANAEPGYNGYCEGTLRAKITVRDNNPQNGILDYAEKWGDHLFDGRLSKLCDDPGTGEMANTWGWGAVASNYFNFVLPPDLDHLYDGGNLTLIADCPVATEPTTWGSIKALYR
jgi:hypothetical protein